MGFEDLNSDRFVSACSAVAPTVGSMNRHYGFPNGAQAHTYDNGRHSPKILPYRYGSTHSNTIAKTDKRDANRGFQPIKQRNQLLKKLAVPAGIVLFLLVIIFPSFRHAIVPSNLLRALGGPEKLQLETVRYYDLNEMQGSSRGWEHEERILICAPLRDAESHLPMFFGHLRNFTYPHRHIDLAFLVSDSKDNTLGSLSRMLEELQTDPDPKIPYGEISIIEKDFGQKVNQDVESRHGFAAQASRRKLMAQARNWLLSAALRPTHSWVYWRDVDVETAPFTILEDLMRHNKDVIVPSK